MTKDEARRAEEKADEMVRCGDRGLPNLISNALDHSSETERKILYLEWLLFRNHGKPPW